MASLPSRDLTFYRVGLASFIKLVRFYNKSVSVRIAMCPYLPVAWQLVECLKCGRI